MGAVPGLLGLSDGANGSGFAAPQGTAITPGTNAAQLGTAYSGTQNSLASQQALLAALQAQGGLSNQSQVYNQLQGVANGTGPNPAQAMLNQATGQNVANQAALMAGQRGAGANVGLMARQAAQQGANIQQQAAGQGATLQANQALNAIGAAGNMANIQAANQMAGTNANTQANLQQQQTLQQANQAGNQANVAMQGNINAANAGLANTTMQGQQGLIGGALQGIGSAAGMVAMAAQGGMIPQYADGGMTGEPQSSFGKFQMAGQGNPGAQGLQAGAAGLFSGIGKGAASALGGGAPLSGIPLTGGPMDAGSIAPVGMMAARGGKVPALVSPGERFLTPSQAREVAAGKKSATKTGEKIPGKANVAGNSYKNDTVPRMLEPGGVVVPREKLQSKNPEHDAGAFVAAVLAKGRSRR